VSRTRRIGAVLVAVLAPAMALVALVSGCATTTGGGSGGGAAEPPEPALPLSVAELRAYADIPDTVITSGGRQWMVLPNYVVAVQGTFVQYRFGEADGVLGPILSVAADSTTLYLGTTRGVNVIDTPTLTIDGFVSANDSTDLFVRWIHADSRREIWGVSRDGVAWLDVGSRTWRHYPFERFSYPDLRQVVFDGKRIWFVTRLGLRRFSREWRAWDPVPGSRELGTIEVYKLVREIDHGASSFGGQDVTRYLWATTAQGLYRYSPSFDSWEFVGR
jgi:hypothetical protein